MSVLLPAGLGNIEKSFQKVQKTDTVSLVVCRSRRS